MVAQNPVNIQMSPRSIRQLILSILSVAQLLESIIFAPTEVSGGTKTNLFMNCLHNGRWRVCVSVVCVTKIIISGWPLALPLPLIAWYLSQHQQNEMWICDRDTFLITNIIGRLIKVPLHYSMVGFLASRACLFVRILRYELEKGLRQARNALAL